VLLTALTAVASVVTPTVVPMVVPTALMHQNTAIATAATVCARSFRGVIRLFIIPLTLSFLSSHLHYKQYARP
jgi:hypothetical protein